MMRIFKLFILLAYFMSFNANATSQRPDYIVINDKTYSLHTNPLDEYFKSIEWEIPDEASISSANWRGYLAAWKIEAGHLLLTDITIRVYHKSEERSEKVSLFHELFPEGGPVEAKWHSGVLIIPSGKLVNYVHMGYGSSYESYIVVRIAEGVVTEYQEFTLAEFEKYKEAKFQAFRETPEFQEMLKEISGDQNKLTEEQNLSFMRSFYAEYYLSL